MFLANIQPSLVVCYIDISFALHPPRLWRLQTSLERDCPSSGTVWCLEKASPTPNCPFLVHLQAQCRDTHGCPMLSMSGSSQLQQTHHRAQLSATRGMPLGKCIQGRAERLRNSRTPVSEKEEEEGKLHIAGADTHTAAS